MGWPDVGCFDAIHFNGFDGLGDALLHGLHFSELASLREHHLIELIAEVFEMRQIRFELFQTFRQFLVHA